MYPFFELFGTKIYMTGLGILAAVFCFIFVVYYYGRKYQVNFWKFFNYLPLFLILPYLFGKYFHFVITLKSFIPWDFQDLMYILSPYGFEFNFIGVCVGFFLAVFFFFRSVSIKVELLKWIDILFYAVSASLVPLGLFLILGDNFIGRPTPIDSSIGISAFLEESQLLKYDQVYPVGVFVSFVGMLSFIATFIMHFVFKRYGVGLFGFVFMLIMMNFPFLFQHYPRHLPVIIGDLTFDIKNYWTIILSFVIILYYNNLSKIR